MCANWEAGSLRWGRRVGGCPTFLEVYRGKLGRKVGQKCWAEGPGMPLERVLLSKRAGPLPKAMASSGAESLLASCCSAGQVAD